MHHLSVSSNLRLDSRTEGFFSLEVQATANKVPSNTLTARIHVPGDTDGVGVLSATLSGKDSARS